MFVFDATQLIYLAKTDRLDVLERLPTACLTPSSVYEEVVEVGVENGYPDARRIERAIERGVLEVQRIDSSDLLDRFTDNPNVSRADVAVLALADQHSGVAVMDERYGRTIADVEGIETRGTAYLLALLVRRGDLSPDEAKETVDSMLDAGWYCAPDLYAKIVRTIDSVASESP